MSDRVQIGGGVLSNRGLEAAMKAHRDSVSPTNRQMIAEAIVAYQRNALDLTSEGEVMDVRRRAKEAANAIGVTPYSDMRPFVEQAVVYALVSHEPGPTDTQERVSVTDAELIAALRREAELFVDDPKPIATMRLAADRLEAALPSGVRVKPLEWVDDTEGPGCPIRFAAWPIHGYRIHLYQWGEHDQWAVRFGAAGGVFLPGRGDAEFAKKLVADEWVAYVKRAILSAINPTPSPTPPPAQVVEMKRWSLIECGPDYDGLELDPEGEWVKYDDAQAHIAALTAKVEKILGEALYWKNLYIIAADDRDKQMLARQTAEAREAQCRAFTEELAMRHHGFNAEGAKSWVDEALQARAAIHPEKEG